jgi:hypothetical protein
MIDSENFEIWCDKPSDREMVIALGAISAFFAKIKAVHTLPTRSVEKLRTNPETQHVAPLIEYDRPDLMIFYQKQPVLVVEITEHGYTGDNPLQRFARAVRSAELGVPFIHFTPFARTRLDELLYSDVLTSARRVSSRLFEGFLKLTRIYHVPVIGVNWPVNERGTPLKADLNNLNQLEQVFGELIKLIERICLEHGEDVISKTDFRDDPEIQIHIQINQQLATASNVLESQIRLSVDYGEVTNLIHHPPHFFHLIGEDYFRKGKDHKLIAYHAIQRSRIEWLQSKHGEMIALPAQPKAIQAVLPTEFARKPWVILYSGYEWRGEPNGGIAANTEILLCRAEGGRTIRDKDCFLAVLWPRVFWNPESTRRALLLSDLKATVADDTTADLYQLIANKRAAQGQPMTGSYLFASSKSIGAWREGSTITRVYRAFCDLVILNDAVLLGSHWY